MLSAWIKIPYTIFVSILVPVYWVERGPANFLWLSDVALLAMVPALWMENRFLSSMMTVGVLLPEIAWNLDFFLRLVAGFDVIGLNATGYMFESEYTLQFKFFSLFHVILPLLLLWVTCQLGYDTRESTLDPDRLKDALKALEALQPRQARVVELRFLGELSVEDTATVLNVSPKTVKNDWRFAKAWLRCRLAGEPGGA